MKRIVLAGASGFIGRHLSKALVSDGFEVVPLNRGGDSGIQWDGKTLGPWTAALEGATAVINLAGAPINGRWTSAYKQELVDSRLLPTRALAQAIKGCDKPPLAWVNGSAIGYYGDRVFEPADEQSPAGCDFLARLCVDWEHEALGSDAPTLIRVIRTGFVLGTDGGALPLLVKLSKAFLGSAVGDGRQIMGWIHIEDLCAMFLDAAKLPTWPEIANGTAPKPVSNGEFMSSLRETLGRPWVPGPPAFLMKGVSALTGISAPMLALASQNAVPSAPLNAGFKFQFPELTSALADLIRP